MRNKLLSIFILLSLSLTVVGQSVFVASSSFDSYSRSLPPSVQTFSGEDVLLQFVGKEVFSKLTPAETEEFKTLCNQPNGAKRVAERVAAKLDEVKFDYSTACVGVQDCQRQVDKSDDYWGKVTRNVQCPVNEDQLLGECKKRLENEKKFSGWEEDDKIYCEAKFERYKTEMARYCKDGGFRDICPAMVYDSQIEEKVKQQCLAKGCTPYADRCGFTSCECRGNPDPIIIDDPTHCPIVPSDWRRMCEQAGGKAREEYRGTCTIPQCDFAGRDRIDDPRYCPQIAIPPGWEEQCRKRGGIPIADDARGCAKAECRMPGRDYCPPLPASPSGVLEKLCTDQNKEAFYGVDPTGCKYFTCVEKGKPPSDVSTPCPEVPQSWYAECKGSGGRPEVKSDPYRPACMQFYCAGKDGGACSSATENEQKARECVSNGGSVYYDYGSGKCPITKCHYSEDVSTCSKDSFTAAMEQSCKQSGGKVAVQYSGSCSYRFCQSGTTPPQGGCPVSQSCPDGSQATYAYHDGKCSIYQCKEKLRPTCPATPACPPGEHAEVNPIADGIGPAGPGSGYCPVYQCKPNAPVTPTSTNEYCPSSAPTACTGDQTYVSEPYAYTTPSGKSLKCYKSSCISPATLPTCTSSCSTYAAGSAYQPNLQSCTTNQRLRTTYMTYTENSKACKCEGSKWCETDYTVLPVCTTQTACPTYACTAGQVVKRSESFYSSTENGQSCKCQSQWCETDYSTLPVCANGPGCQTPTCAAGETLQSSSGSPYSTTVNGVQCACTSKWCSSSNYTTPGVPGGGGTCPYMPTATCTGSQVSINKLIPGYQNCYQPSCVDATSLPACTTMCSPAMSTTPSCSAGQIIKTGYSSMTENGQNCRCESRWCETDPATCASATCPATNASTSCPTGQVLRTSTTPYTPPGCGGSASSSIQCTSTWCETDQSQCASQTCPAPTPCAAGFTLQPSTTYWYTAPGCSASTSIPCPGTTCVASTANVSASRVTGLDVYPPLPSPSSIPYPVPSERGICTSTGEPDRVAFVQQCLEFKRGNEYRAYSTEGVDEICKREVIYNKAELEKFCAEGDKPYDAYRLSLEGSRARLGDVYSQCRQFATKERLIELIEKKADVECKKASLAGDALKEMDLLLTSTDLPPLDVSKAEVAANTVVLTQAQLEELKQEIRRDVVAQVMQDLSQALGLRANEESQQAAFKLEQAEKMQEAANSMKEVCLKLEGNEQVKCDAAVAEIEQRVQAIRREADQQSATAGGIGSLVQALVNLLGGK